MKDRIFKSPAARDRLEDWYQRFLQRLESPVAHRIVATTRGDSHVLVTGTPGRPPLVCLHGSLSSSAHVTTQLGALLDHYEVYAPDLPGQSVRGPQVRLPFDGSAHANWLVEVLDGLRLTDVHLLGVSWGGYVGLQTALRASQRVRKLVLLVPAGIVGTTWWTGMTKVVIPLARYSLFPSDQSLRRFLEPQCTTMHEEWTNYLGDAMRGFHLDLRIPPLAQPAAFEEYQTPTLVVGASDDVHFPGRKLLARVQQLMPHAEVELLTDCRHAPPMTDDYRHWQAERVTAFLGN